MAPAKRIREGTLVVDRYNVSGLNFPRTCSNDCNRSGRYRMLILGWPAGDYCEKCVKGMTAAWESALSERVSGDVTTPASLPRENVATAAARSESVERLAA